MFARFKQWYKRRTKVTFHFKSGNTTSIWCEDFKVHHDGNRVTSYRCENTRTTSDDPLFWVSLNEIEFITLKRRWRR